MDENGKSRNEDIRMEERKNNVVYMWGYLPGASPEKAPILSPVSLSLHDGDLWKDVCGGGCGFALAISGSGRLMTWGSTDDEGQIYLTSGGHGETPETFSLPTEAAVINAAAGWAHCVSVTEKGQVYTWGWKECVPSGNVSSGMATEGSLQKDSTGKQTAQQITEQGNKKAGEEIVKRRKTSSRDEPESSASGDEYFTASPTLVSLAPGVRITTVAAGGRHTLVLSGHKKFEAIGRFLMLRKDT